MQVLPLVRPLLRRFKRENAGHIAMMTAMAAPMGIALAAVAVDTASLHLEKRRAQGLADLAAITAAANLDKAEEAVRLVFADNGIERIAVGTLGSDGQTRWHPGADPATATHRAVLEPGRYTASAALSPAQRFARLPSDGGDRNAVKVTYNTTGTRYFAASLIAPPQIAVQATAATDTGAAFSVGSRLLELDGGIANALLRGLTGSNVQLSVMDYEALLAARISLLSFIDALAGELDLTAANYSEVLDAKVSVGQVARAISTIGGIEPRAATAARKLGSQAGGANAATFPLSRLIGIDGATARASVQQVAAKIDVMELLTMGAILAGQGRQVKLDLGATVPGLLAVSVDLAIGEPLQKSPWFTLGEHGKVVRTAQTRLRLVAEIGNDPLISGVLGARVRIPLYLELAYAEARLKSVSCPTGRPESIKVAVEARPGIANLYLAEVEPARIVNFANPAPRSPARLVQLAAIGVAGQAQAEIGAVSYRQLVFDAGDIASVEARKVSTDTVVTSLTQSLLSSVSLEARIELGLFGIPLVILPPNAMALLGQTVGKASPALDGVLNELLKMLGLSLGQAEIRVHGATCGRAVLVQ